MNYNDPLAADFAAFMAQTAGLMATALDDLAEASKGVGSGNWGHAGRPGRVGGSARGGGGKPTGDDAPKHDGRTIDDKLQPYNLVPATTRQEAEQFALKFAKSVDYEGMTLPEMNTANRVLAEALYAGRMPKLDAIYTVGGDWDNGVAGEGVLGIGLGALHARPDTDKSAHSMAYYKDMTEALLRHEVGHLVYQRHTDRLDELLPYRKDWEKAYGVTARAKEDWNECLAENFSLYSIGRIDLLHPDMVHAFEQVTRYRWR